MGTVASRVDALREEAKLSVNALNSRCGFSEGYVSRMLRGDREQPKTVTLEIVAVALGSTLDYIARGAGPKYQASEPVTWGWTRCEVAMRVHLSRGRELAEVELAGSRALREAQRLHGQGEKEPTTEQWVKLVAEMLARPDQKASAGEETEQVVAEVSGNHVLRAGHGSFKASGGAVSARVQRGSLIKAQEKLLEKYPRAAVFEVASMSEFVDADQRPETIDLYLELERRVLEFIKTEGQKLSSSPPSGGNDPGGSDGVGAGGDDPGAPVPSNREIKAALDRAEERFDPPKPTDRRQAKARRR
jgi:transcriptional regulator with XRE-family HTH domain